MARVTARQAFTRAKTKRDKRRCDLVKSIVEARNRYIRQLSGAGIAVQDENSRNMPKDQSISSATKRSPGLSKRSLSAQNNTKITDFFSIKSKGSIENSPKPVAHSPRGSNARIPITSSVNEGGFEVITIDDDDDCNQYINASQNLSISDSNNNNDSFKNSFYEPADVKPFQKISLSDLGTSFQELDLRVKIDEDVEIVEMLPPIPLRNHPVYAVEDD